MTVTNKIYPLSNLSAVQSIDNKLIFKETLVRDEEIGPYPFAYSYTSSIFGSSGSHYSVTFKCDGYEIETKINRYLNGNARVEIQHNSFTSNHLDAMIFSD
jgi:hypothetical protein